MANGKDRYRLTVGTVQNKVAAASKVDPPFPILRIHILDGSAEIRLMCQNLDPHAYCPHGSPCGVDIFEG